MWVAMIIAARALATEEATRSKTSDALVASNVSNASAAAANAAGVVQAR